MPNRTDVNHVSEVLMQLQKSGVINLDTSMREMLGASEALGKLSGGNEVASTVIAWDGYGLVLASQAPDLSELSSVAEQLRRLSSGPR